MWVRFIHLLHRAVHSLLLCTVPWNKHSTTSTLLLVTIWDVSTLGLMWLRSLLHTSPDRCVYAFLLEGHLGVQPLARRAGGRLVLADTAEVFQGDFSSWRRHHQFITVQAAPHPCRHLVPSALLLAILVGSSLWVQFALPWWVTMLSSFHTFTGHLDFLFCEMPWVFCPFLKPELPFLCCFAGVLYISWVWVLCQIYTMRKPFQSLSLIVSAFRL